MKNAAVLLVCLWCVTLSVLPLAALAGPGELPVKVVLVVGFPSGQEPATEGKLLLPGTVLLPGEVVGPPSAPIAEQAERLKGAFNLAKVEVSPPLTYVMKVGEEQVINTPAGNLDLRLTLVEFDAETAALRVGLSTGDKESEAKLMMRRGTPGIMGGRDGEAAPFFFVSIEPLTRDSRVSEEAVHRVDEKGITTPKLVYSVPPTYPEEARKARVTGTVVLQALVDEHGVVQNVEVLRSLEKGCTDAAVHALRQWRYEPARFTESSKPVAVFFTVTIAFRLN
ncbi:MAG: energy transducer TonB [Thermoanaerobaculaceae bacterium]|nr:energy transducer TonB [Thermoanaerobaculaceae bacterium]MDI9622682.1 energy transducer TonB [Acidobacteriota bacterium]NLH11972.1 energy transducer TonB [Holophagae bacterium]HPW55019.1 energy transducer TonB [Thermoanaerobaculaceae bacterium]